MSLFDNLLIGHLVGDFLFQTAWMANGKNKRILPLIVHSTVYTLCIFVFSFNSDFLSWSNFFILIGTHVLIDSRKITYWWMSNVMRVTTSANNETWLVIVTDQIFHLLILYILLL
jgi:hypothetical protein